MCVAEMGDEPVARGRGDRLQLGGVGGVVAAGEQLEPLGFMRGRERLQLHIGLEGDLYVYSIKNTEQLPEISLQIRRETRSRNS